VAGRSSPRGTKKEEHSYQLVQLVNGVIQKKKKGKDAGGDIEEGLLERRKNSRKERGEKKKAKKSFSTLGKPTLRRRSKKERIGRSD